MCARKVREKCFNLEPKKESRNVPSSRLETRVAAVDCPATGNTQRCNVPQSPLCYIHMSVRVCATLLSWLRRLSFSSRNSIKQTRTREKLRELEMFVTFLIFCCPKCGQLALYERQVCNEFCWVYFASNPSFCLSLALAWSFNWTLSLSPFRPYLSFCSPSSSLWIKFLWGHFVSSFCFNSTFNVNICN